MVWLTSNNLSRGGFTTRSDSKRRGMSALSLLHPDEQTLSAKAGLPLRAIDAEVIPTRLERKDGSMRGKTKNLSEWALKSLSKPETLNQRVS